MIDLSSAIAVVALMWTIYQQYQISKMCTNCAFRMDKTGGQSPIIKPY